MEKKSSQSESTAHRTHPPSSRTMVTRSQGDLCGDVLRTLPREVFFMILDRLTVRELGELCMASKKINGYVGDYIWRKTWQNKWCTRNFHPSTHLEYASTIQEYRDLSLLFRRCTLFLPTNKRLGRLRSILTKFAEITCFSVDQCPFNGCFGSSFYSTFLHNLIAGWDELECQRAFSFLCDITSLPKKVQTVTAAKPGVRLWEERQMRFFCRDVLLEQDKQRWLTMFLRPWPIVSQARLLLILYGPARAEGPLMWQDLVNRELPQCALLELASAITLLYDQLKIKDANQKSLLALLEELIVIPQPWHVENVARLLVLCSNTVCYTVLGSKAINRRVAEATKIIVYITVVCEKDGLDMSRAVKLVLEICKFFSTHAERLSFIQHLEKMFSQVIKEMLEHSAAGNQLSRQTLIFLSILVDSSAHFRIKFLQMLLE